MLWGLTQFRIYLLGRKFIYESDNRTLTNMLKNIPKSDNRTSRKLNRYINFINSFIFDVHHRSGNSNEMALADYLSRNPIQNQNEEMNIENIENFARAGVSLTEWITATGKDHSLTSKGSRWKRFKNKLFEKDNLYYVHASNSCKLAVPVSLRERLLNYYHTKYTVHGGYSVMVQLICRLYIFPNMHRRIKNYVNSCTTCAQTKSLPLLSNPRNVTSTSTQPGQYAVIDLVGPISKMATENGNRYILTYMDLFTGWLCMRPIKSKHSANVLEALSNIFCEVGVPLNIQSDCGKEFTSNLFTTALSRLGIQYSRSSPYNPKSQGRLERKHAEIGKMLKILVDKERAWDLDLAYIAYKLNTTPDKITNYSPWSLFHGIEPRTVDFLDIPIEIKSKSSFNLTDLELTNWENELTQVQKETFSKVLNQKKLQKENWANSTATEKIQLKKDDIVFAKLPTPGGKLNKKLSGPYRVVKVTTSGAVILTLISEKHGKTILLPISKLRKIEDILPDEYGDDTHPIDDDENKPSFIDDELITLTPLIIPEQDPKMEAKTGIEPQADSSTQIRRSKRNIKPTDYKQFF